MALAVQRHAADAPVARAGRSGVMERRWTASGLPRRAEQPSPATLSYGHQRLLEVAMGLALQPKLLILDEPTQGLSDGEIDGFCELVRGDRRATPPCC